MTEHAVVHRRHNKYRHPAPESSCRKSRDRGVVDPARNLSYCVCRAGCNKQERRAPAVAAVGHVFNKTRDPGDGLSPARVGERVRVDDSLCCGAHDRLDTGAFPAQRVDQPDRLDRCNAAGHSYRDLFSGKGLSRSCEYHILHHMPRVRAEFLYLMYLDGGRKTCPFRAAPDRLRYITDTMDVDDAPCLYVGEDRGQEI